MQDNQLEDLKQFVASTVGQSEQRIKEELRVEINHSADHLKNELIKRMDDGFAGVADAMEELHSELDNRLTKLEEA